MGRVGKGGRERYREERGERVRVRSGREEGAEGMC